jgi:glycosyltransferase involved in cell wall biosynthesis
LSDHRSTDRARWWRAPWSKAEPAPAGLPQIEFGRASHGPAEPAGVPVIINSFNQPTYLRSMLEQLSRVEHGEIVVLDQASTYPPMLEYLQELESELTVVRLRTNNGPHWLFTSGLALTLPKFFIYTDADIRFPADMPAGFIGEMIRAVEFLQATKLGLALDISQPEAMKRANINIGGEDYTFATWESQFWRHPLSVGDLQLYEAPVDTTFALYNRREFDPWARAFAKKKIFDCMDTPRSYRLAGRYTSTHLPWMLDDPIPQEELDYYCAHRANFHTYLGA